MIAAVSNDTKSALPCVCRFVRIFMNLILTFQLPRTFSSGFVRIVFSRLPPRTLQFLIRDIALSHLRAALEFESHAIKALRNGQTLQFPCSVDTTLPVSRHKTPAFVQRMSGRENRLRPGSVNGACQT